MKKLTALLATLLIAAAGSANANVVSLINDTAAHKFTTSSDAALTYNLPGAQAGDLLISYNFSFTGSDPRVQDLQNNDFLAFWLSSKDGPNFGVKANCGDGTCGNDLFVRTSGTGGVYINGSNLVAGTTYQLVGYLHKTNGSATYNEFDMWVNPTADELATLTHPDAIATGGSFKSFNSVGFRTANIDSGIAVTVSDINISAVPEPATLSLMGLAAAGMGFLRRRKNA